MQFTRLLYATDIMRPSFSDVERLTYLRRYGLKEIVFLYTSSSEGLEGWESRLADLGIDARAFVVQGSMAGGIVNAARRESASMIAACLKRESDRVFGGSLAKELLRKSDIPVLIMRAGNGAAISAAKGKDMFSHPVFATDWSAASQKAIDFVLGFKEAVDELEIVHVIDRNLSVRELRDLKGRLTALRKMMLDRGIDAESHVYAGSQSDEILLAARDYNATCIVMGAAAKPSFVHPFRGSHWCRVAEASVVPTVVVP